MSRKSFYYDSENKFWCEGCSIESLAQEFGTPLYIYSAAELDENITRVRQTINDVRGSIAYALKANANPSILSRFVKAGIGADVVSGGELMTALRSGFPPSSITYAGVGKRDEEIELALQSNINALVIESIQELEVVNDIAKRLNTTARILIRVNPDIDADTHPYISTGLRMNKFGIEIDQAAPVFAQAASMPGIDLLGIHTHLGSQIIKSSPFVAAVQSLVRFIEELRTSGTHLRVLDLGGGFGVQYINALHHKNLPKEEADNQLQEFSFEIIRSIIPYIRSTGCSFVIEPGRSLVASSGAIVTKVLFTKKTSVKKFIIVDASMTDLIRPSLYHAYHQIVPAQLETQGAEMVDVVGPVCETTDFIAKDRVMPPVERGDILAVLTTGAYGYALASNYNMRPRSAEVLVEGKHAQLIRKRETLDDLFKR